MGLQGVKRVCKRLQGVTELRGFTGGYIELQRVTGG